MPSLIGNKPNQVPSNGDLGTLAFQDASNPKLGTVVADGLTVDTTTLVVDTVNDRVGIGVTPSQKLDVLGGIRSSNGGNENIFITSGTNTASLQQTSSALYFNSNTNTTGGLFIWRNSSSYTTVMTLNANGALALQGGNTSASGVGVAFPATQSASTDANTLDDYEEGTWTPTIAAGLGSFTSYTSVGVYTKVGRIVTAYCSFQITDVGTGNTFCSINGYPFAANNPASPSQQASVAAFRENSVAGASGATVISKNATSGSLFATFATGHTYEFTMVYQTS